MPKDANGNMHLDPIYRATAGEIIQPAQHNTPLLDIEATLSGDLPRDGRAPMLGNLSMGGFRVTELGPAQNPGDATPYGQVADVVADVVAEAAGKSVPDDADNLVLLDNAVGNSIRRLSWANVKAALKVFLDTLYVPLARTVATSGLATGGGNLTANRTINVPASSQAQAQAGTDNATVMTPLRTAQAIAALTVPPTTFGAVGTMVYAWSTSNPTAYNVTRSGSTLRLAQNNPSGPSVDPGLAGTWRALGTSEAQNANGATLWIRIS